MPPGPTDCISSRRWPPTPEGRWRCGSPCSQRRGFSPPLHVHSREDEAFYLLDGELTFRLWATHGYPRPPAPSCGVPAMFRTSTGSTPRSRSAPDLVRSRRRRGDLLPYVPPGRGPDVATAVRPAGDAAFGADRHVGTAVRREGARASDGSTGVGLVGAVLTLAQEIGRCLIRPSSVGPTRCWSAPRTSLCLSGVAAQPERAKGRPNGPTRSRSKIDLRVSTRPRADDYLALGTTRR